LINFGAQWKTIVALCQRRWHPTIPYKQALQMDNQNIVTRLKLYWSTNWNVEKTLMNLQ